MGKYGKKNHVSLNPLDANICLLGTPKVGKTTIMKQIAEKLVGEDGYLFLEMFHEGGAKYIENIVYEDVPDWDAFTDIIDDIVDNRTTDYADLKVVFLDTIDNALQLAEKESLRLWNKSNPDKRTDAINAAWGGFQRGQDKAMELLQDQLFKLRTVGVAFSIIGHIKITNVTDPVTLETYQQLTSDVSQRYFNQLKKNIDLIGIAYVDRTIITEGKGQSAKHKVSEETRKIKFRDSNYTVDAGGRMSEIVDEISFNADDFIKAMKDALEAEVKKGGASIEDRQKEDKKVEEERLKDIAKSEEVNRDKKALDAIVNEITDYMKLNKSDLTKIKPLLAKCKEFGVKTPVELTNIEDAKAVLELIG